MTAPTGTEVPRRRLAYQPGLDGLRAVAVVAVLLYHENIGRDAPSGLLSGGFLGVDIFFVLSGFLITGLLLADHSATGTVVSTEFWIRRARRLLPALFLLLVLVSVYALLVAPGYSLGDLRRESVAALFYVSNWVAIAVPSPQITPLSHLWSLAVEEQWYLVWPLLLLGLLAVTRGRRRGLMVSMLVLAGASFALMLLLYSPGNAQRVAAGTDTRAWELLLGAVMAAWLGGGAPRLGPAASRALDGAAVLALVFLAWTIATVDQTAPWLNHGGLGLVAIATLVVVAAAIDERGRVVRRGLSWRPLVAIGLISYGLYLYHLLVYTWLSKDRAGLSGAPLLAVRLAVLFALAFLSYRLVEMPVRRGTSRLAARVLALPVAFVVVLGVVLVSTRGATPASVELLATQQYKTLARTTPPGAVRVLVAGDQSAFAMGWRLRPPIDVGGIRGTVAATVGCGIAGGVPVDAGRVLPHSECRPFADVYGDAIDAFRPAVSVLMVGNGEVADRRIGGRVLKVGSPALASHLRHRLERARRILTAGHRPLVILTVPCADPAATFTPEWARVRRDPRRIAWVNAIFRSFAAAHPHSVSVADLDTVLCPPGNPHPTVGAFPYRPDGVTLSATGVLAVWRWLAPVARATITTRAAPTAPHGGTR